jgi:hypothetical protein
MPDLTDINQMGVKMLDTSKVAGGGGLDALGGAASLLKLQMDVAEQPQIMMKRALDIKKAQQDIQIAENEIMNLDIVNQKLKNELQFSFSEERRKQSQFITNQIKHSIDMFRVDPVLGANSVLQAFPNAKITQEGKAYKATIPTPDGNVDFVIDPNKVLDPEKRIQFENEERERFLQNSKDFKERSDNFRNMMALKDDATGASDIAIFSNFSKIQDPGGRVTGGDVSLALRAAGFSEQIVNAYNRAVKDGGAILGGKNSPTRQAFMDTVTKQMRNFTEDMLSSGRYTVEIARSRGLDGKSVVAPVGGLQVEDFMPVKELSNEQLKKQSERLRFLGVR